MGKQETAVQLIEIGAKAMLEKGYHAVGLQEILAEAKVPKGSFYYYFKSKEQFGISIIDHYIERKIQNQMQSLLNGSKPARQRLCEFFAAERQRYMNQTCQQEGCRLIVKLANELSELSPEMRAALVNGINRWVKVFATCIEQGIEAGEFVVPHSPEETAEYIYDAWTGAVSRSIMLRNLKPYDFFVTNLFETILRERA